MGKGLADREDPYFGEEGGQTTLQGVVLNLDSRSSLPEPQVTHP